MMSVIDDSVETMNRAARKITYLRALLKEALPFLPTEDQCCDEDRLTIRRLRGDIFEETGESL